MTLNTHMNNSIAQWIEANPEIRNIIDGSEYFWVNPLYSSFERAEKKLPLSEKDIMEADQRLKKFAPYISHVFHDTKPMCGIIESPLLHVPELKSALKQQYETDISGKLLIKCDNLLPVSGSIKARGGIYEVLKHAESLAVRNGMISEQDNYSAFSSISFRNLFSDYSIAAGSTGNLGLSIGIIGAELGFQVYIHMSSDARQWKKDLLRSKGVTVVEYNDDYSKAVLEGRKQAENDPHMHFIDDENSEDLFLGYAVAAYRLKNQLNDANIIVDAEHPLMVYLPCGVGGGPGGITFGLKQVFKDHVHCFFAEPVASPCMLLGLWTGLHHKISVHDIGLSNITDADGLAVGSPSGFVGQTLKELISGVFTVKDMTLYELLRLASDTENLSLEPSALAGMPGPQKLCNSVEGQRYLCERGIAPFMSNATHIVWATGGNMVPESVMKKYYSTGTETDSA